MPTQPPLESGSRFSSTKGSALMHRTNDARSSERRRAERAVRVWRVADEGPRALVIVATVLLVAGVAACLVPVRRVFEIEPAMAMRSE